MRRVKIFGAGSIGNHLANACRHFGWEVHICDIDPDALHRTKNDIYPTRYGSWDDGIQLHEVKDAPKGDFDLIVIGTPPDSHFEIALSILKDETPKSILIEKPLCRPSLQHAQELYEIVKEKGVKVFTGYDHVLGLASKKVTELINEKKLGTPETIDVEFREHWGGIFNAHPWLEGPHDSYLGFWERGGGSLGEHSHALNLWQYFSLLTGAGKVGTVNAMFDFEKTDKVEYDKLALLNLKTDSGMVGRVVQDVVTKPTRKWGRIQWKDSAIEWIAAYEKDVDAVKFISEGNEEVFKFPKNRPQDFILEVEHIDKVLTENLDSPISFERGLETMLVIAGAYQSGRENKPIKVEYNNTFNLSVLK